jgi:cobalt/nickel transport system permease protein
VLAYGANVVNIAIVMPLVAYGVYKLISGRAELTSARRVVAAAVAGYLSLTAAALLAGIELGIQPDLFHDASGTPLYSPYHLAQTIPAMLLAHLLVAGVVEAALTGGVVLYLQRANLPLLQVNHPAFTEEGTTGRRKFRPIVVAGIAVGVMTLLTPLGLLAPGGAFGEDAPGDLNLGELGLSAVPAGLNQYAGFWRHAIFSGYELGGDSHPWVGYVISAVIGILVVGFVVFLIGKAVEAFMKRDSLEKV